MSNETNTTANWTGRTPRTMDEAFKGASYGSPYCPGVSDISDPWFAERGTLVEEALGVVCVLALISALYAWFVA